MSHTDPSLMANAIRFLSMDAIERAGDGHPGAPLGCAEISTALFTRHLRFNPSDPNWFDRDRFVLSNGHGSMLIYSLLYLTGYERISIHEIERFRTLGSHCAGHPEYDPAAGIEVTTGPLGQGIANAVGMAVAEAFLRNWLGAVLVSHRTYALVGDGCLQEGVGQEVISLAGHLGLGGLTFLWDDNRITDDGVIDIAQGDDMCARFRLSGWHVQEVDGHDVGLVDAALQIARADARPSMIACRTMIGRGIPRVQGQRGAHGGRLFPEDLAAARAALNWPHERFVVPEAVLSAWRAAGRRSQPEDRCLATAARRARAGQAPAARPAARGAPTGRLADAAARLASPDGGGAQDAGRHQQLGGHCRGAVAGDSRIAVRRAGP